MWSSEGVNAIRKALMAAESCAENLEEVTLTCHYDGAPHYKILFKIFRAPDYPTAESPIGWEAAQEAARKYMDSLEGSISIERL